MNRQELIKLLYQNPQPTKEITSTVIDKMATFLCTKELPTEDGEYLVYHSTYGWCVYGFTVKDQWGFDNQATYKDGSTFNKVIEWGSLKFLEA